MLRLLSISQTPEPPESRLVPPQPLGRDHAVGAAPHKTATVAHGDAEQAFEPVARSRQPQREAAHRNGYTPQTGVGLDARSRSTCAPFEAEVSIERQESAVGWTYDSPVGVEL